MPESVMGFGSIAHHRDSTMFIIGISVYDDGRNRDPAIKVDRSFDRAPIRLLMDDNVSSLRGTPKEHCKRHKLVE